MQEFEQREKEIQEIHRIAEQIKAMIEINQEEEKSDLHLEDGVFLLPINVVRLIIITKMQMK